MSTHMQRYSKDIGPTELTYEQLLQLYIKGGGTGGKFKKFLKI